MQDMPRPRPPHLHPERTRHGELVWYVRVGHGPRIRIRAEYGTPEFQAEYQAAINGEVKPAGGRARSGTLSWLIDRYRDSSDWSALSKATHRQRINIFKHVIAAAGSEDASDIDRAAVMRGIDRRKETPAAARNFLEAMKGLFRWAASAGFVSEDPTVGLRVSRPATDGFPVWSEEDIAKFEARWPLGTRERLAFDILIYTGLRRGDAAVLGRQHIKDGIITITTEKTGERVTLPVLPPLQRSIDATPTHGLALVSTISGKPMVKESFGTWFKEACKAAGVEGSAHGLRKAAATRAAESGATVAEMEAIFGWRGGGMAALYTKKANRQKLAFSAAKKMLGERK